MRSSCWCQHTPERGVPARGTAGRPPWTVLAAVGPCAGGATTVTSRRIAWASVCVIAAILVAASVLLVLGIGTPLPEASFGFKGWGLILASAFGVGRGPDRDEGPVEPDRLDPPRGGDRDGLPGARNPLRAVRPVRRARIPARRRRRGVDHRVDLDPVHGLGRPADPDAVPDRHPPVTALADPPRGRSHGCPLRRTPLRARTRRPRRLPRHPEPGRDRRGDVDPGGGEPGDARVPRRRAVCDRVDGDAVSPVPRRRAAAVEVAVALAGADCSARSSSVSRTGPSGEEAPRGRRHLARSDRVPAGRRTRLDPGGDRRRDPQVPPLRHRRRDQEDGRLRDPRRAPLRARRSRRLDRSPGSVVAGAATTATPSWRAGIVRRARGVAAPEGRHADRGPARLRTSRDPVPGAQRVLRSRRGDLRERRRAGADGAGPRDRGRRGVRDGVAARSARASTRAPRGRSDDGQERAVPASAIEVRHQGRGPRRTVGSHAVERPDGSAEGAADPRPRRAGRTRPAQRRVDRRPQGVAHHGSSQRRTRSAGGSSATSTTAHSSSSSRSP